MKTAKLILTTIVAGLFLTTNGFAQTPVAFYSLDGNVSNASTFGSVYNGTVNGSTAYGSPGLYNQQAFSFNGSTDIATTTTNSLDIYNSSFTVDLWINLSNPASTANNGVGLFGTYDASGTQDQGLQLILRNDQPYFGFYGDDNGGNYPGGIQANTWYNVAYTYNASSKTQTIYVDGVQVGQGTVSNNFQGSGQTVYIGGGCCSGGPAGLIQDVGVYGSTLNATQIQSVITPPQLTWTGAGGNANWDSITTNWQVTAGGWYGSSLVGSTTTPYADSFGVTFDDTGTNTNITIQSAGVNPSSVTFNNTSAGNTYTFGNAGSNGIGGTATVALNGSGTVNFTSPNTYSGGTKVNAGVLNVTNTSGSATGSGAVTIGDNSSGNAATLSGNGTISGAVTINGPPNPTAGNGLGGTIAGASGGTLRLTGGLTLQTGSISSFSLGTPNGYSNSALIATSGGTSGSLVVNGASTIDFTTPQAGVYDLYSYTGGAPNAAHFSLGSLPGGFNYQLINNSGQNQIDLIVTALPIFWTGNSTSWDSTLTNTSAWVDGSGNTATYSDGLSVTFGGSFPTLGGGPNTTVTSNSGNVAVVVQSGGVNPAAVTFTNSNPSLTYTFSDAEGMNGVGIYGSGSISLTGTGTVTFTDQNTFSGPVSIAAGQLNIQNGNALGSSVGVSVASGAALQLQGGITTGNVPLSIDGTGLAGNPNGALQSVSGANTYAGAISIGAGGATITSSSNSGSDGLTLNGGITNNGNLVTINGIGPTTVSAPGINGTGGLTYSGSSTLTLSAANSFTGLTTISSGTLSIPIGDSLAGSLTYNTSGTSTIAGTLGDAGSVLTVSNGTLILSGANTYGGGTALTGGTIRVGTSRTVTGTAPNETLTGNALGFGLATLASGTTLQDNGSAITLANSFSIGGTVSFSSTGSGSLTLDGTGLSIPATVALSSSATLVVNNTTTINDVISGSGFGINTSGGTGTLILGGANTFTGGTTINPSSSSSIVQVNNINALQDSVVTVNDPSGIVFNSGIGQFSLGGLSGSAPLALNDSGNTAFALTLGNSTGAYASYSGNLTGGTTLTKVGTNTQMLSGSTAFTGIIVSSGTLRVAPSALGTAPVTLSGGALGIGSVTDAVNLVDRWTFAGNANDSVGTANGVLGGGATVSSTGGIFGNGYVSLNGTGANVNMGALPSMTSGTQARTISAWVYQIASPATGGATNYFGFFPANGVQSSGFYFDNFGGGPNFTEYYNDAYPSALTNAQMNGSWNLLTATWDGGTSSSPADAVQIYANGVLVDTLSSSANGGSNILNDFGIDINRPGFQGYEDDLRVYNTALTASQVAAIYNGGAGDTSTVVNLSNAVNVTASSAINLAGSVTFGNLGVTNGSTLSVTGSGSLTFGPTTISGSPTFNVVSGNTLTLGQLYDGGNSQTITLTGGGTLTLATPVAADNLQSGTIIDINGDTLNSNATGAIGSFAQLYAAGTFNVGASQTISALSGPSTGAVFLGNNTLTIGNTDNITPASGFAGVISDSGSGAIIKNGTGTLTLAGGNTYQGGTTINAGTLVAASSSALGTGPVTLAGGTLAVDSLTAAANLVDRWSFTGTANDTVGTTNGALGGGATVSSTGGVFGNGYVSLNGTGANVNMGALPSMTSGTQARTISAWVYQTANPAGGGATNYFGFFPANGGHSSGFYFDNFGSGSNFTEYYDDSGTVVSNAAMTGSWNLLTATWDGDTSDPVQIYANGLLVTTLSSSANGGSNILNNFGVDIYRADFNGDEDDLRVYNTALTAAQVAAIYNGGAGDTSTVLSMSNAVNVTTSSTINVNGVSTLGALSIASGLTLNVTGSGTLTVGATTIAGSPTFNVATGNTLTLGQLSDGGSSQTITLTGGGTLTLATPVAAGNLQSGTMIDINGGTLNSNANGAIGSFAQVYASGTLRVGASQTISSLSGPSTGAVSLGNNTLTIGNTDNITPASGFAGVISDSGSGAIIKNGTGTLTLSGANTYQGGTTINAGTLIAASGSALGTGPVALAGGALSISTLTDPANLVDLWSFAGNANDSVGTANGALGGGATVSSTGGKFGSGAVYLNGTGANVNMGALPSMTSGTQARTISAWVEETATPAGGFASNYFGFFPATSVNSSGFYFDYNNGVVFTEYFDDSGSVLSSTNANNSWHLLTATWDGNTNDNVQIYVDGALATTLSSSANGGSNILNDFGVDIGRTDFQGYEDDLRVYNTALTPAQVAAIYNGGAGDVSISASNPVSVTASSIINLANGSGSATTFGNLSITNGSMLSVTGTGGLTFGATTISGSPTFNVASGANLSLGSLYDGLAAQTITLSGGGSLSLNSAATSLVQNTVVNVNGSATLNSNNATALGSYAQLNVASLATFNVGASQTVSALNGTGAVGLSSNALTIGNTDNLSSNFSGSIGGVGGGLRVNTTGTVALSGANTYSGGTAVSAGTLRVANPSAMPATSATGTGPVTVSGGATLAGSGTTNAGFISGSVTANSGAIISPSGGGVVGASSSVGTLTVGGLSFNGTGATLNYQAVNFSAASDLIAVTGALALPTSGTTTFNFYSVGTTSPYTFVAGDTYQLMSYNSITGGGSNLNNVLSYGGNDIVPNGYRATFSTTTTSGSGYLDLVIASLNANAPWATNGSGSFDIPSNWSGTVVPSGAGLVATFGNGDLTNPDITVTVGNSDVVGGLIFNNTLSTSNSPISYTLSSGNLTLNSNGAGPSITVSAGGVGPEINTPLLLADGSGSTTTFNVGSGSYLDVYGPISETASSGQKILLTGGGTLELDGANTYTGSTTINAGTLLITAAASIKSTSISVAAGATLQLAGTTGALPSTANITTGGTGGTGDGAVILSGTATETVGVISGTPGSGAVTTYAGNTTVGDGTNAANLTATQILQNTLTINAGSTVTIAPSGSGIPADEVATSSAVATSDAASSTANADSDSTSDPFTAIEDAIAAGSISSAKGQQLENRIAAIERLAVTDPGLNVSLLEDRVLAALPATSVWSSSGASPLIDAGSGLLALDSSTFASSSATTSSSAAVFAPAADFGGNPAAVPEPSTLLLAILGGIGGLIALRRRTICCE